MCLEVSSAIRYTTHNEYVDKEFISRKGEAMTTFDLAEVRGFAADLEARMDRCDNGEGTECANLDGTLRHYAVLCCEFCEQCREWGRAIFAGQSAFDPEVERLWIDEGVRLYGRAQELGT